MSCPSQGYPRLNGNSYLIGIDLDRDIVGIFQDSGVIVNLSQNINFILVSVYK